MPRTEPAFQSPTFDQLSLRHPRTPEDMPAAPWYIPPPIGHLSSSFLSSSFLSSSFLSSSFHSSSLYTVYSTYLFVLSHIRSGRRFPAEILSWSAHTSPSCGRTTASRERTTANRGRTTANRGRTTPSSHPAPVPALPPQSHRAPWHTDNSGTAC